MGSAAHRHRLTEAALALGRFTIFGVVCLNVLGFWLVSFVWPTIRLILRTGWFVSSVVPILKVCGVMNANLVAHQLDRICSVYSLIAILAGIESSGLRAGVHSGLFASPVGSTNSVQLALDGLRLRMLLAPI